MLEYKLELSPRAEKSFEKELALELVLLEDVAGLTDFLNTEGQKGILGVFKLHDEVLNVRAIAKDYARHINGEIVSVSMAAKIYLYNFLDYINKDRLKNSSKTLFSSPAKYAKAGFYKDMVYVDIKGFYYSIYKRFIDVLYDRRTVLFQARGKTREEIEHFFRELQYDKLARNVLVSLLLPDNFITRYKRESKGVVLKNVKVGNIFGGIDVVNFIYDVSLAISLYAVKFYGCVYANIDGFIIPAENLRLFTTFLEEHGLPWSVKDMGDCEIIHVGCYKIGNTETLHFAKRKQEYKDVLEPYSYSNLNLIDFDTAKLVLSALRAYNR